MPCRREASWLLQAVRFFAANAFLAQYTPGQASSEALAFPSLEAAQHPNVKEVLRAEAVLALQVSTQHMPRSWLPFWLQQLPHVALQQGPRIACRHVGACAEQHCCYQPVARMRVICVRRGYRWHLKWAAGASRLCCRSQPAA